MTNWIPGLPVITDDDVRAWKIWRRSSKLECQRSRRLRHRRIDYYPSDAALTEIAKRMGPGVRGTFSAVIDALVMAASKRASGIK